MTIETQIEKYFKAFSQKDIVTLQSLFHENVTLRDWENEHIGFEKVIEANTAIFNSVEDIEINILNICIQGQVAACELQIFFNKRTVELKVVDILEFSDNLKIQSIRAFQG